MTAIVSNIILRYENWPSGNLKVLNSCLKSLKAATTANYYSIIQTPFPGLRFVRAWYPLHRIRDDLLWGGQCDLFPGLRISHEVHRKVPDPRHGSCAALRTYCLAPHLEAGP